MQRMIPATKELWMKIRSILLPLLFTLALAACNFSLAEDITPPPDYRSPTPQPTLGPLYPSAPPSPARGAALYTQECQPCHGDRGLGNGPLSQQMPVAVPAIGLKDVSSQYAPADWFSVVSLGSLERGMPPFLSLSTGQRWDVVSYVFQLSASPDQLRSGAALYAGKCAACHGAQGRVDGPQAAGLGSQPTDFTDPAVMSRLSGTDLYRAIAQGVPPAMAAYAGQLSDSDIWNLVAYLRSLSFDLSTPTPSPAPSSTPIPTLEANASAATPTLPAGSGTPPAGTPSPTAVPGVQTGTVTGKVAASSGASLPSGLMVTLRGFDQDPAGGTPAEVVTLDQPLASDGNYTFGNVPMPAGRIFQSQVDFGGIPFASNSATAAKDTPGLDLGTITLYPATRDLTAIQVDQLHIILDFSTPGSMQVIELYVLTVPGQQAVVVPSDGTSIPFIKLPAGATNASYQVGSGSAQPLGTGDGFALVPLPSGQSYALVAVFDLPYPGRTEVSLPFSLPVASASVLSPNGVRVQGGGLSAAAPQTIQGVTYQVYAVASLPADATLDVGISGSPSAASSGGTTLDARTLLTVGLGALGLILIGIGVFFFLNERRRKDGGTGPQAAPVAEDALGTDVDRIADAILLLDDQFKAGAIEVESYKARRARLKERLREALEARGPQGAPEK